MRRSRVSVVRATIAVTAFAAMTLVAQPALHAGAENWNDDQIKWRSYEDGLKEAKQSGRPVCLIFYTTWCPHCANYSKLFSDPQVVEKAKSFVMIRVDNDKSADISNQYHPDGAYIPRTFFLSSSGQLDESLSEGRPSYKYFYNETDPTSILAGMDRALKKLH
jgi:thiol:disulfide interchange protein